MGRLIHCSLFSFVKVWLETGRWGWPQPCNPLTPASWVLGLKVWANTLGSFLLTLERPPQEDTGMPITLSDYYKQVEHHGKQPESPTHKADNRHGQRTRSRSTALFVLSCESCRCQGQGTGSSGMAQAPQSRWQWIPWGCVTNSQALAFLKQQRFCLEYQANSFGA